MVNNSNELSPPGGYYESTSDWYRGVAASGKPVFYEEYVDDNPKAYRDPRGLDNRIHWKFTVERQRTPPPSFLAVIPNGRVWGDKGAIISPDNNLLWDLSMEYGKTPGSHPIFQEKQLPQIHESGETLAVLSFCASQYYYHWMFDVLPRVALLRRNKVFFDRVILNYNNPFGPYPFQKETLSVLGISKEIIIECHRQFHLRVKRLVTPSLAGYTGHIPKWTCDFLRRIFLPNVHQKLEGYERIYLSRETANYRKLINEMMVMKILKPYGFRKVLMESRSVSEQARICASADIIVSAHGGGLTNLVFCNPGTKVLEFFSPNYVNVLYWIICNHVSLDYYYLIGEGERPQAYVDPHIIWDDILVNPVHLSAILDKMNI